MERVCTGMVTIIVAMYKGEKYIRECIDSIINQDFRDLEIFLVNDGSPDDCGIIADEYAKEDYRIKVIHQDNSGVSAARNNALEKASGEYICILDQDDIISEDYVSYFYNLCKDNHAQIALTPKVDKFFGSINSHNSIDYVEVVTGEKAAEIMLYHKIVISPWNKIFETRLIRDNNILFNTKYFNGEGFAFSIECYLKANRVAIGHKKVYHYRVGDPETGASKFKEEYILSSIGAQEYIKNRLPSESMELNTAWKFSNWHTYCDCLNIMIGCNAENYYLDLYERLRTEAKNNALLVIKAPISVEQKFRGILFKMNPIVASKIINKFRVRKFTKYIPETFVRVGGVILNYFYTFNCNMVVAA